MDLSDDGELKAEFSRLRTGHLAPLHGRCSLSGQSYFAVGLLKTRFRGAASPVMK